MPTPRKKSVSVSVENQKCTAGCQRDRVCAFFFIFCCVYYLESIGGTYIISIIQSIERQFQIPSKMSGALISAQDVGYVPTVIILSYLGSRGNRARWIGGGCIAVSIAHLIIASPHFLFTDKVVAFNETAYNTMFADRGMTSQMRAERVDMLYNRPGLVEKLTNELTKIVSSDGILRDWSGSDSDTRPSKLIQELLNDMSPDDHRGFGIKSHQVLAWEEAISSGDMNQRQLIHDVEHKLANLLTPTTKTLMLKKATDKFGYCNADLNLLKKYLKEEKCLTHSTNLTAYSLVFIGLILLGVGHSMPWSLGLPLMDDNVKRKSLPTYFASMFFIKILGPISGFFVGGLCNQLYYTLEQPFGITTSDPRWIGAWWLGFLLISGVLIVPSIALFCFPRDATGDAIDAKSGVNNLEEDVEVLMIGENSGVGKKSSRTPPPSKQKRQLHLVDTHKATRQTLIDDHDGTTMGKTMQEIKTFWRALVQVILTPIYTFSLIGRVFDSFAFKGFYVFLPKYLDNHYGIPQHKANIYLGSFGIVGFASGVLVGSFVMRWLKLEGRRAAIYVAVCALIAAAMSVSQISLGCTSTVNSIGVQAMNRTQGFNFTTECNSGCGCDVVDLSPVCSASGAQYYSPCHAGCTTVNVSGAEPTFSNCRCIDVGSVVSHDNCEDDCANMIVIYFAIAVVSGLISGMGVVPAILIVLRAVPPEWRSISIGVSGFVVSIGTLFSPPFYGIVIDSACILWEPTCGQGTGSGSCRIYDPQTLRTRLHMVYGVLRACGSLLDLVVVYFAKDLLLMADERVDVSVKEEDGEMEMKMDGVDDAKGGIGFKSGVVDASADD